MQKDSLLYKQLLQEIALRWVHQVQLKKLHLNCFEQLHLQQLWLTDFIKQFAHLLEALY